MKSNDIARALRNSTTPAARLAAWQNRPLFRRLERLRNYYNKNATMAEKRAQIINGTGPEMSAEEYEKGAILWVTLKSPEVSEAIAGRDLLTHRGWYTDEDYQETIEAYAVCLTRFPGYVFEATRHSVSGNLLVELSDFREIDFSKCESDYDATDARNDCVSAVIRSADDTAKSEAEDEREYQEKWRKEQDLEEKVAELKTTRHDIRTLARELKSLCPLPLAGDYPTAARIIRAALQGLLSKRLRMMDECRELRAELA